MKHVGLRMYKVLSVIGAVHVGVCAFGETDAPETVAEPVTARWTGAAGNSNPAVFGNWDCFDAAGTKIPDALPTAATAVLLSGNLAIDIPAGTAFPFATLSFDACTVMADCDWRGLDLMRIGDGGVVDLSGHALALSFAATPTNSVTFTDSTAEPAHAGTLRVEVPSGKTVHAGTFRFTGTLKLAKEGEGALELPDNTAYAETGDTTVAAGTVKFTGETALAAGTGALLATNSMPTIDLNGQTVAVGALYDQGTLVNSVANFATVVFGRGNTDATLGFAPPANVKVRKEGSGTLTVNSQLVDKLEIAQGGVVCKKPAFRHYRFVILRPWGSTAVATQFSEFKLLDGETDVTSRRAGVSQSDGSQEPLAADNSVDRDFSTKFYDVRASGPSYATNKGHVYVQLDYAEPQPITGYDWATADDRPNNGGSDERDPADWFLMGSDDGETWITLDRRMNYYATIARKTWVGPFTIGCPMNVTGESADTSLTLDGVNFMVKNKLSVGSVNLANGGTLTIPQYKWFRFSVKQLEGGNQMQLGEFALYDEAGNRVNQGLAVGSTATALSPGTYVASGSVDSGDYLFDGKNGSKWWCGGNSPLPSNPATWNVVTMRLADDAAAVVSYNLATANDSESWYQRNPKVWQLEASVDGVNWLVVDEKALDQGPHANEAWYNGGVPYKVFEPSAAVVAGSGDVVKTGGGDATFQGSFTGDVGLRVEAGRLTIVPELSRCKWFRFSVKQLEDGNQMQLVEFALYDEAGNRVNQGLAVGSTATALSPGSFFASGEASTGDCLFDGQIEQNSKWWCGGNSPLPSNPATWNVVTMRLADDAAAVVSYNLATADDSEQYWRRNPKVWQLEASVDGVNWLVVDEQSLSQGPHANWAWYNNGVPYKVNGGIVVAPEAAALARVSVAAGAELNLPPALPVKGLEVDASGVGSINNLELAPSGVIDIVNAAGDEFSVSGMNYRVPLTIGELSGSTHGWHVRINGADRNGLRLRKVGNALYIRPNIFVLFIR